MDAIEQMWASFFREVADPLIGQDSKAIGTQIFLIEQHKYFKSNKGFPLHNLYSIIIDLAAWTICPVDQRSSPWINDDGGAI
jgi:hypothetical protein